MSKKSTKIIKEEPKNDDLVNFYNHPIVQKLNPTFDDQCYKMTGIKYNSKTIIIGSTGSGKSSFVLNYLSRCPYRYGHITIVNSGMVEPLYEFLEKQIGEDPITFFKYNELPPLNEFGNKGETQLLVCDDLIANKKQEKLEDYAIRCRKHGKGVSMMYLSQKYYSIPIIIRAQAQYIIIIKVSDQQDLKRILKQSDIEQLIKMYEIVTAEQFGVLKIDLGCNDLRFKFSKTILRYFSISSDGSVSL
jgi:dephospho-CoA kinase